MDATTWRRTIAFAFATAAGGAALITTTLITTTVEAGLVTKSSKCAGQSDAGAPERAQEKAMRCLINSARDRLGARGVDSNGALERAAGHKVGDVMRCGFSHTACGQPADLYAHRFGYTSASSWQWGENLAYGNGKRGTARKVFAAWLDSEPHREAMLNGSFEDLGVGLRRSGDKAVWVLQLGCRGC
jgi:uncharacterized protein YkwD